MKNIPSASIETHEEPLLESHRDIRLRKIAERNQEVAKRNQEAEENNHALSDYLKTFDGMDSDTPLGQRDLLFLYNFPGKPFETLLQDTSVENKIQYQNLFTLACQVRDHSADLAIMLGCNRAQIANTANEIAKDTKAFIGDFIGYDENGIIIPTFKRLSHSVDHIYTKFPEGKIRIEKDIVYGDESAEEIREEFQTLEASAWIDDRGHMPVDWMSQIPKNTKKESAEIIFLSNEEMGLSCDATQQEFYSRAEALGLKINFSQELALALALRGTHLGIYRIFFIGMNPIMAENNKQGIWGLKSQTREGLNPYISPNPKNILRMYFLGEESKNIYRRDLYTHHEGSPQVWAFVRE